MITESWGRLFQPLCLVKVTEPSAGDHYVSKELTHKFKS